MLKKIKGIVNEMCDKWEEEKREKERLEREKLEQEKARLLSLDEKELLVELIFMVKKIENEQKELSTKVGCLESQISNQNLNNYLEKL